MFSWIFSKFFRTSTFKNVFGRILLNSFGKLKAHTFMKILCNFVKIKKLQINKLVIIQSSIPFIIYNNYIKILEKQIKYLTCIKSAIVLSWVTSICCCAMMTSYKEKVKNSANHSEIRSHIIFRGQKTPFWWKRLLPINILYTFNDKKLRIFSCRLLPPLL